MAEKYGISEAEFKIIQTQAARRAEMRREFLKQRTNPWKQAAEAGYVFDAAHQRFVAMKVTQLEFFQPNRKSAIFGLAAVVLPMVTYGYLLWKDRYDTEQQIRKGEIRYRDRIFKFQ